MDPSLRVVTSLPLTSLWDEHGEVVPAGRVRDLGVDDVRQLLREEASARLVIANVGSPLRWIDGRETYRSWKEDIQPHLAEPARGSYYLEDFPAGLAYVASEWRAVEGAPVVVFEAQH